MNRTQDLLESLIASIENECISDDDAIAIQSRIDKALSRGKRNHFWRHCQEASERVKRWPKWKQNILTDSAKPTLDIPRQPVVND